MSCLGRAYKRQFSTRNQVSDNLHRKEKIYFHHHIASKHSRLTLPSEGNQSPTPGTFSFSFDLCCAGATLSVYRRSSQPHQERSVSKNLLPYYFSRYNWRRLWEDRFRKRLQIYRLEWKKWPSQETSEEATDYPFSTKGDCSPKYGSPADRRSAKYSTPVGGPRGSNARIPESPLSLKKLERKGGSRNSKKNSSS